MNDGPWNLTAQRWRPDFKPREASIKKIAAWIRIPDLPIEYYDKHFLWKVDIHTIKDSNHGRGMFTTERGRFARISVELNLNKKLVSRVKIRNILYLIEYEGLSMICFERGKYGHHKELCPTKCQAVPNANLEEVSNMNHQTTPATDNSILVSKQQEEEATFGSWMLVKRNTGNRMERKQNRRDQGPYGIR